MQEIQAMMKVSANMIDEDDGENEDEFDGYMEQNLLQDVGGEIDRSGIDPAKVYEEATK